MGLRDIVDAVKLDMMIDVGDVAVGKPLKYRRKPDTWDDLEAWKKHLSNLRIGGCLPITFNAAFEPRNGKNKEGFLGVCWDRIYIRATMSVLDADTPDVIRTVAIGITRYAPSARPDKTTNRFLRAMCRELYLHDLDEWLAKAGMNEYYPHPENKTA